MCVVADIIAGMKSELGTTGEGPDLVAQLRALKPRDVIVSKGGTGRILKEVTPGVDEDSTRYSFEKVDISGNPVPDPKDKTFGDLVEGLEAIACVVSEDTFKNAHSILIDLEPAYIRKNLTFDRVPVFIATLNALGRGESPEQILVTLVPGG